MSAPASHPSDRERHLLIEASAGSGKTHHLVGRILGLLISFRQPERIIALTFTRKAAGEFFDRILGALAQAATSDEGAARAARDYAVPGLTRDTALALLRLATDSLHRLALGTLDSFYARVLRTFPGEFGIGGTFEVIREAEETAARREVFDAVLSDLDGAEDFLGAFRQATFGSREKRLLSNLENFVSKFHRLLIACPDRDRWSMPTAIWPEAPWWLTNDFDITDIVDRLRAGLPAVEAQHKSAAKGLASFAERLPLFCEGAAGREFSTLHIRALALLDDLHSGDATAIEFHKKGGLQLDPALGRALADGIGFILQREFASKLQQTGGIHDIVRRYETLYHARIRRSGRLSFDDILILLSGAAPDAADDSGQAQTPELCLLDDRPDADQRRLRIDFRLDGQFHHWLIDEFQDTGRRQWQVLQNLIDEVIDDDSGDRSFYYVGDEKQAIYGWRGGDSRLFKEVQQRYNQASRPFQKQIHEHSLDESWRSGPVILDAVNHVFGNLDGLTTLLGPDHAPVIRDRWRRANPGRHIASPLTADRTGYVQFVTIENSAETGDESIEEDGWEGHDACWRVVLDTLRSLDPVANGLSVAILTRRTQPAAALADFLRQHGEIPVMMEGQMPVGTDHPIATSFRALLQFAAHPGDEAAWQHLVMTPALLDLDHPALGRERFALPRRVLEALHDRGFGAVFQFWTDRLRAGLHRELDAFSERRIRQIAEACRRFDLKGSRSIGEFLTFLENYGASDAPSAGVVQIMTIHKAKGLTYDAVIVADLKTKAITSLHELEALKGYDEDRRLRWILTCPRKELALAVEPLRGAYLEAEMDCALEELCALYVALTRAKYANYIVTPALPKDAGSTAPHNLLARQFEAAGSLPRADRIGGVPVIVRHESGDPDWVAASGAERAAPLPTPDPDTRPPVTARRRYPTRLRRTPSNAADKKPWGGAARLFSPDSVTATDLGSIVHFLFEQIPWIEELNRDRFAAGLARHPELAGEALAHLDGSLAVPDILRRFQRDRYRNPILWLEKRFEMITPGGEWVSGVFDRVVLERDTDGSFLSGHIIDFKSNRVSSETEIAAATEHYRSQMTVYRGALSRLTGLAESNIGAELIFTRPGVARKVF